MPSNQAKLAIHRQGADPLRACVHDLRNPFAVVASAKALLERCPDEDRERLVLDALGQVAVEGKIVTDALLGGDDNRPYVSHAGEEVATLIPILGALEHPALRIVTTIDGSAAWVGMAPAEFRAVVLELATNSARAGAHSIRIKVARRGCRCWLVIADDGSGFATAAPPSAAARTMGLHGTGLRRLTSAVDSARGKLRIRSKAGHGSVIALILPITPVLATPARETSMAAGPRIRIAR
jgi:signal transduction histidine kinase